VLGHQWFERRFWGILGAGLAAVIYKSAGALVFPVAETFRPVAKYPTPRLMAHLTIALCVAAGALFFANHLTIRCATAQPNR
jgi:hypothetical protein